MPSRTKNVWLDDCFSLDELLPHILNSKRVGLYLQLSAGVNPTQAGDFEGVGKSFPGQVHRLILVAPESVYSDAFVRRQALPGESRYVVATAETENPSSTEMRRIDQFSTCEDIIQLMGR